MAGYNHRKMFIVPLASRASVNSQLELLGYGPDNFSVELVPGIASSSAPATHYICDIGMTDQILSDFRSKVGVGSTEKDPGNLRVKNRLDTVLSEENLKRRK